MKRSKLLLLSVLTSLLFLPYVVDADILKKDAKINDYADQAAKYASYPDSFTLKDAVNQDSSIKLPFTFKGTKTLSSGKQEWDKYYSGRFTLNTKGKTVTLKDGSKYQFKENLDAYCVTPNAKNKGTYVCNKIESGYGWIIDTISYGVERGFTSEEIGIAVRAVASEDGYSGCQKDNITCNAVMNGLNALMDAYLDRDHKWYDSPNDIQYANHVDIDFTLKGNGDARTLVKSISETLNNGIELAASVIMRIRSQSAYLGRISFDILDGLLYECVPNNPDNQHFFTIVKMNPCDEEDESTWIYKSAPHCTRKPCSEDDSSTWIYSDAPHCSRKTCDPDEPEEKEVEPHADVHNCCEDNTNSTVYLGIDELFSSEPDCKNGVRYFTPNLSADKYKVATSDSIFYGDYKQGKLDNSNNSKYFQLYCTDNLEIQTPSYTQTGIQSYFEFKKTTMDGIVSQTPIIKDREECRLRIRYDLWLADYINAFNDEISKHNALEVAIADSNYWKNSTLRQGGNGTITISYTQQPGSLVDDKTCTAKQAKPIDRSTSKTFSYSAVHINSSNPAYYEASKTGDDNNNMGVSLLYKTQYYAERYVFYTSDSNSSINDYRNSHDNMSDSYCEAVGKRRTISYSESTTYKFNGNYIGGASVVYNDGDWVNTSINGSESNLTNKASQYAASVNKVKALEDTLYVANEYFRKYAGYNNTNPTKFGQTSTFEFKYYTEYLSTNGKPIEGVQSYDTEGNLILAANAIVAEEDLYNFGTTYGDKKRSFTDLRCSVDNSQTETWDTWNATGHKACTADDVKTLFVGSNRGTSALRDSTFTPYANFTTDGTYINYMTWNLKSDPAAVKLSGSGKICTFDEVAKSSVTKKLYKHDKPYSTSSYLQQRVTTSNSLSGKYQVYWYIKNYDGRGLYDELVYSTSKTCKESSGYTDKYKNSDGMTALTCPFITIDTVSTTGTCLDGDLDPLVDYVDGSLCTSTSDSGILASFKVVDPQNIFPNCDADRVKCFKSLGYGYNWLIEDAEDVNNVYNTVNKGSVYEEVMNADTFNPNNISYSITLNSSDIKAIRIYNDLLDKEKEGYEDFSMTCKKNCGTSSITNSDKATYLKATSRNGSFDYKTLATDSLIKADSCRECYSDFLTNLGLNKIAQSETKMYVSDHDIFDRKISDIRAGLNW